MHINCALGPYDHNILIQSMAYQLWSRLLDIPPHRAGLRKTCLASKHQPTLQPSCFGAIWASMLTYFALDTHVLGSNLAQGALWAKGRLGWIPYFFSPWSEACLTFLIVAAFTVPEDLDDLIMADYLPQLDGERPMKRWADLKRAIIP
ncbi:unnamed protein product [Protopolystoma xenopodis]|uniref:Uncharacterized protein n=1 Tax=Protopolystoma xenopodis TaxID=117903 RepID=A0A448WI83_9PLAT|nr:unnamed protein product [Protopolystoma xenopodis]